MVRYGIKIEHKNGKNEFNQYQSMALNIEHIEKAKEFYHNKGSRIFLIKFEVIQGSYNTLEKTEY